MRPTIYVPYAHGIPVTPGYLAVRGSTAAIAAGVLRRAVASSEESGVLVGVHELPQLLSAALARPRFQTTLAGCFAVLALVLAIVGISGLLSLLVRQRRREIGIRIAVGATPSAIRGLVLRQGIQLSAGIGLGVVVAWPIGRLIQPLLFEARLVDPAVLFATAVCVLVAVIGATTFPMPTAARTDPLTVLRGE